MKCTDKLANEKDIMQQISICLRENICMLRRIISAGGIKAYDLKQAPKCGMNR